ncbi:GTP-binding protein Rhes-like [Eupeodes corollae]|uniref:GTP-binding protein Rhes-like n=1 Tax=Eupeodes corollae TaxID=290404 RepID=UPI002493699A|nr:GTP-binding protein Rhes-like [Eupeodes corollae]
MYFFQDYAYRNVTMNGERYREMIFNICLPKIQELNLHDMWFKQDATWYKARFPAMRALSISSADAFILVYDVTDSSTFDEVRTIRDQIHETKGTSAVPIVVVGNKIDLVEENSELREIDNETTESVVMVDWENGFVEASACKNENITQIFKELLSQAKITYNLSPALRRRRRQSLPPNQMGNNGHPSTPSSAPILPGAHVPSAAQLQHLQRIQERSLGGKRNSCSIS